MFSKITSGAIHGVEGMLISVEADVSDGLPMFTLVGFLASEVKEANERVRTALRNSGFSMPARRVTVNLSPADVRKEGAAFDLPIAIAILSAMGHIPENNLSDIFMVGELGLDGQVKSVNGVLSMVDYAKKKGKTCFFVPKENEKEAAIIENICVIGVENLKETVFYLKHKEKRKEAAGCFHKLPVEEEKKKGEDFADIKGQELVKRAVEIAVAGMHNLLMIGPPGAGKSMIAKRIPTIMPSLSFEESLEITKIYSVRGMVDNQVGIVRKRPFRSPHHTISQSALVGGGKIPKPGEMSLAHYGVLFLDELPEFSKHVIEAMRQPLEDKKVTISRVNGGYTFPTDCMLVAAMNPCPCGNYPDFTRCRCSDKEISRYVGKISQPLLDRIDINIETKPVLYEALFEEKKEETSKTVRERILKAQEIQRKRYQGELILFNGQLSGKQLEQFCPLGKEEEDILKEAFEKLKLSARGSHRILRVARTIGDLEGKEKIERKHLMEAIAYRTPDSSDWRDKKE